VKTHKLVISWLVLFCFTLLLLVIFREKPMERQTASNEGLATLKPRLEASPKTSIPVPAGNIFLDQEKQWRQAPPETSFSRFVQWTDRFLNLPEASRARLQEEGIQLAKERRELLRSLIQTDPERALAQAVPEAIRRALPGEISSLLEERVSGRGELDVLAALPEPGKQVIPVFRRAYLNDREFQAFVYGRRLGVGTRQNIPLHGIAIDDLFAVNENPVRIVEPVEAAEAVQARTSEADVVCSVSDLPSGSKGQETVVAVGEDYMFLCEASHVEVLNARFAREESGNYGTAEASNYTEGNKRLILIRVDFSDLVGVPVSDLAATNLITGVDEFYRDCSYHKASFARAGQGSDITPTLRMPRTAAYYGGNNFYNDLRTHARSAASAAGYVLANYDFDIICLGNVPAWSWGGLAHVGAPGAWLRNNFSIGVAAHELGHNYGLNHANYWDTSGASVIGPGASMEYGDWFDTMGLAIAGNNQFNARYKQFLNWLTINDFATCTTNGTYRIYAHDNTNSTGLRALKIPRTADTNYWVEFRQKFTTNKWVMNGAGLRWAENWNESSLLLDTTPGSPDKKDDSAIVIGRTYSDTEAGVHITPIGKGGTTPESLDVVVYQGVFATNVAPTVTLNAPVTQTTTGASLSFTAAAHDENGDALAYYWDFGDSNFGTNAPSASKSWSTAGEYVVRCTVTDMRGGTASDSVIVRVGTPSTYRISGKIMYGTNGAHGVRVYVSTTRMAYTDSDGTYSIVGLPAGSYTVSASLYGYSFTYSGFANPVSVGPNATNINFTMSANPPLITAQPQSQNVFQNGTLALSVTATGPELEYQWFLDSSPLSGETSSSYLKNNVQTNDSGSYTVEVSNSGGTFLSAPAVINVNIDTTKPTLTVFSPKAGFSYTNPTSTLSIDGSASDDAGVVGVEYSLNNAAFAPTTVPPGFWTYWQGSIDMAPGTNVIRIRAVDIGGNYSLTNTRTFYWHAPSTLTLTSEGLGQVTATASALGTPTNGAALLVGRSYSFTAKGGTNWILTNVTYTTAYGESGTVFINTAAAASVKVPFTMKSNMTIHTTFITNPMVRLAGTYNGLFFETNGVRHHSAGYAMLKPTKNYGLSGKLFLDGNSVLFSGNFKIDGTMTKTVSRAKLNKPDLVLNLELNSSGVITGSVAGTSLNGETFFSPLSADRWMWTTNNGEQALQFTNRYTMLISGMATNSEGPYGYGYANVDLTSIRGRIVLSGQLSDSYRRNVYLSQSTTVSSGGAWPLFVPLYYSTNRWVTNGLVVKTLTEYQGELLGWLHFLPNTNAGTVNLAPLGKLDWIKTGWTNTSWTHGFTNQVQVISSRHIPPIAKTTNRVYRFTNAWMTLEGGQLSGAVSNLVNLKTNNTFFVNTRDTNNPVRQNFKATLTARTGSISGTFTNATASGATNINWYGVMLQDQNYGMGFFMDHPPATNSSGRVTLVPRD
jgi:hypothetical protein